MPVCMFCGAKAPAGEKLTHDNWCAHRTGTAKHKDEFILSGVHR